jgi:hypothetical protein
MNITCTTLEELEDGGAIVELEMDEQSKIELINIGFVALLEKYVEQQLAADEYEEDYEEDYAEEEYAEAPDYSDFVAELQTCYEYHMGCDDSEHLLASVIELLVHYMGEEEADEYFASVSAW